MRDFVPEKPVPSHSHISSAIFRCTTQCYSFRKCIGLTTTFLDITYVREITRMLSYSKHQLPAARCSGCAWAEWRKNKRDRTEKERLAGKFPEISDHNPFYGQTNNCKKNSCGSTLLYARQTTDLGNDRERARRVRTSSPTCDRHF